MADPDVVVIGSGPTGAMAVDVLVRRGLDVLLLDAGRHMPGGLVVRAAGITVYRRMAWADYESGGLDPSSGPDVDWYASHTLGGLSNYWTAAVPRMAPEDFTEGARIDERFRWPVTYADLEAHYGRAERMLTVTAGDPILRLPAGVRRFGHRLPAAWRSIAEQAAAHGHGVGAMPMAKGRRWMIARRGTEFNSYRCVIEPLLAQPSFRLVTQARVLSLHWSGHAGRVDGVEYLDMSSGERRRVGGRAVVVAAGAIDSTVLMLRSRSSDFPDGLGNHNGLVGRYLHDHPREWWPAETSRPVPTLVHPVYITRDAWGASSPLMATSLTLGLCTRLQRLKSFYGGSSNRMGVQVFGTMVPKPDVGVSLVAGDDPATSRPRITLAYDDSTLANLFSARRRLVDVLGSAGVGVRVLGPFHEVRPGSSVHWGGSLRMHTDPRHGVLDAWNRVHDAPNVLVVDSSAFTTGAEKNPTLTAMALAARAAMRLADDLSAGTM